MAFQNNIFFAFYTIYCASTRIGTTLKQLNQPVPHTKGRPKCSKMNRTEWSGKHLWRTISVVYATITMLLTVSIPLERRQTSTNSYWRCPGRFHSPTKAILIKSIICKRPWLARIGRANLLLPLPQSVSTSSNCTLSWIFLCSWSERPLKSQPKWRCHLQSASRIASSKLISLAKLSSQEVSCLLASVMRIVSVRFYCGPVSPLVRCSPHPVNFSRVAAGRARFLRGTITRNATNIVLAHLCHELDEPANWHSIDDDGDVTYWYSRNLSWVTRRIMVWMLVTHTGTMNWNV